jgi:hypothetical protein
MEKKQVKIFSIIIVILVLLIVVIIDIAFMTDFLEPDTDKDGVIDKKRCFSCYLFAVQRP